MVSGPCDGDGVRKTGNVIVVYNGDTRGPANERRTDDRPKFPPLPSPRLPLFSTSLTSLLPGAQEAKVDVGSSHRGQQLDDLWVRQV